MPFQETVSAKQISSSNKEVDEHLKSFISKRFSFGLNQILKKGNETNVRCQLSVVSQKFLLKAIKAD